MAKPYGHAFRDRFVRSLQSAEIAVFTDNTTASYALLPVGAALRRAIYREAISRAETLGYREIIVPHLLRANEVQKLDSIAPVSANYLRIQESQLRMAATHEVPVYTMLRDWLRSRSGLLPARVYTFGPVFRWRKNTTFPFSFGERTSFLELYGAFESAEEADSEFNTASAWNRAVIQDCLALPAIEVERPLSTNRRFSTRTICIDTLTPLSRTVNTGMTYRHGQLFSRLFHVKGPDPMRRIPWVVHFGLSDNLFWSFLVNAFDDRGFCFLSGLSPVQVVVVVVDSKPAGSTLSSVLEQVLQLQRVRYRIERVAQQRIGVLLKRLETQGVPVVLLLYPRESAQNSVVVIQRATTRSHTVSLEKACNISSFLDENDAAIRKRLSARKVTMLIRCTSIAEMRDVLASGRVAQVGLLNAEKSVSVIETHLEVGEVLGFETTTDTVPDILTGQSCHNFAYLSRRT